MLSYIYKRSMVIGDYFNRFLKCEKTDEWSASEECATFTKLVYEITEILNISDITGADTIFELIRKHGFRKVEDHMWDDYCKGFLAGQILGIPTADNIRIAETAENIWNEDKEGKYGYYQEILNELAKMK